MNLVSHPSHCKSPETSNIMDPIKKRSLQLYIEKEPNQKKKKDIFSWTMQVKAYPSEFKALGKKHGRY